MDSDELTRSRNFRVVYDDDIEDDYASDDQERDEYDLAQEEKLS